MVRQPLVAVDRVSQFDVLVSVAGGGLSGQAGAVRHGIAKALTHFEPELRPDAQGRRASSPATPAWWSARSTAAPRPVARFQFSKR